jgi:hypothetical protein
MTTDIQELAIHASIEGNMADTRSNHAWTFESAPVPTRFVRKQAKGKVGVVHAMCGKESFLSAEPPKIADLDDSVWSFMGATNHSNSELMFYTAHRKYVAQEIATEASNTSFGEDWDLLKTLM